MHIYWFAYYDSREPSVRYRCVYALEYLQKNYGVSCSTVFPAYNWRAVANFIFVYLEVLFFRKRESVIVFEKIRTNRLYANMLKVLLFFRRSMTIYDIDDADYLNFSKGTIDHFMKKCSVCTAGSEELVKYAKQFNPHSVLLTSPIIKHQYIKKNRQSVYNIGWVGYYRAHKQNLSEFLFPALFQLDIDVKLTILGVNNSADIDELKTIFAKYPGIELIIPENVDWFSESAINIIIARFDVGVAPMINTEYNKAKSAFKLKQYMSCGVPVVVSDVGENNRFLKHGENGYLCRSVDDFEKYLRRVYQITNVEYGVMSQKAHDTINCFDMKHYCARFIELCSDMRAIQQPCLKNRQKVSSL